VIAVAPDYWRPKTAVATKASTTKAVVNAAGTSKLEDKTEQQ
jgi:hypothetical protein